MFAAGILPSQQALARFRREAETASRLDHPDICTVFDAGVDGETPYIAMRLIEGRTLAEWIESARTAADGRRASSVDLPTPSHAEAAAPSVVLRVVALVERAARALHAAHEAGLVHRDVKPGNIMVTKDGAPVLLDFGLARHDDAGHTVTLSGTTLGTPAYMSPEQLLGVREHVDRRTDVYSLGVTLYECLTLRRPFEAVTRDGLYQRILRSEAEPPRRANPDVPRDLEIVVLTAMEKDRDRRYATAIDLADDLGRLRRHESIRARSTPAPVRLGRMAQRNPAVATGVVAAFAVLAVGLGITAHFLGTSREEQRQTQMALDERTEALRHARAVALASTSRTEMTTSPMTALLLAREAVRLEPEPASFAQLREAIFRSRERALLRGHANEVSRAVFSPQGDRLVTASRDGTARIWDDAGGTLAVLRGHKSWVKCARWSALGDRIVTSSTDKTARVWDASGKELAVLRGHAQEIETAAFSPDGALVVTASADGTARIWKATGEPIAVLRHAGAVRSASFSPSGGRVLTASSDATAAIWNLAGERTASLRGHGAPVEAAAFSADGRYVVTGSRDCTARVWTADGREVAVLRGHDDEVTGVAFSPSGDLVATSSADATARVWDATGAELAVLRDHAGQVVAVAISPDGKRIATAATDGVVGLWDTKGRLLARLAGHEGQIRGVSFSPKGDRVVSASGDGTARVWSVSDAEDGCLRGHDSRLTTVSFSPRGDQLLTASEDGTARLWNQTGDELAVLRGHSKGVLAAVFSPSGDRIATGSRDGDVRVWSLDGRESVRLQGHASFVSFLDFSRDGESLVSASSDGTARIWKWAEKTATVLKGHAGGVRSARFSPRGDLVLTTSSDATARLWNVADGGHVELQGHRYPVSDGAFSPVGDVVVTTSNDRTTRVWDRDGRERAALDGPKQVLHSVAFSPDGRLVLAASNDQNAWLWELSGRRVAVMRGHRGAVEGAWFSPSGDRVLTASADRTARIWDLEGRELARFTGHDGALTAAGFSPDGTRIVTASTDGTARVWLVRDDDVLALAESRITRGFTIAERLRYAELLDPDSAADVIAAGRAVERLSEGAPPGDEFVERIKLDAGLTDRARALALGMAAEREGDSAALENPHSLAQRLWGNVVSRTERSEESYRAAAAALERAAAEAPDDGVVLATLGAARYRIGDFADAASALRRSVNLNARRSGATTIRDVAFLAMACARLGDRTEARRTLSRYRALALPSGDASARTLLQEAENVVESTAPAGR